MSRFVIFMPKNEFSCYKSDFKNVQIINQKCSFTSVCLLRTWSRETSSRRVKKINGRLEKVSSVIYRPASLNSLENLQEVFRFWFSVLFKLWFSVLFKLFLVWLGKLFLLLWWGFTRPQRYGKFFAGFRRKSVTSLKKTKGSTWKIFCKRSLLKLAGNVWSLATQTVLIAY